MKHTKEYPVEQAIAWLTDSDAPENFPDDIKDRLRTQFGEVMNFAAVIGDDAEMQERVAMAAREGLGTALQVPGFSFEQSDGTLNIHINPDSTYADDPAAWLAEISEILQSRVSAEVNANAAIRAVHFTMPQAVSTIRPQDVDWKYGLGNEIINVVQRSLKEGIHVSQTLQA